MKFEIFLLILVLCLPSFVAAENSTGQEETGILSSLPDIEITSAETYNNSTGQSTQSQSRLNWIIILGIVLLAIVIYSFDIDPKWVILAIGVTAFVYLLVYLGIVQV